MKMNQRAVRSTALVTHEGAPAKRINAEQELRRSLMACMLWEKTFYESGEDIADRIKTLVPLVSPGRVADMALEARTQMKLRHAPLLVVREMARLDKHKGYVGTLLPQVIQRADELSEFLAIYWQDGRQPLSKQVKVGLAAAIKNFDAYQLAKYNRDSKVRLRDVMFLVHPKPDNEKQAALFMEVAQDTLPTPDTWEVALSSGADKKETWTRLLTEGKLGALALLRNLRNMEKERVSTTLITEALDKMKVERVLPFRFIAAARYAPALEPALERAMFRSIAGIEKLPGRTVLLIDVSGSMGAEISSKSEMTREDAASGLAVLAQEMCEESVIFSFSNKIVQIPPRHGFALRDAINKSQPNSGTYLGQAISHVNAVVEKYDRLIVFTDEQSHDLVGNPTGKGYMVNVATNKNGVGYGIHWNHIDGFSEAVLNYIREYEK